MAKNKVTCYIFAGGGNTRWINSGGEGSKELAAVDGIPVIVRTIQQMRLIRIEPIVVTTKPDIIQTVDCEIASRQSEPIANAVFNHKWGARNILLLGDVYYSEAALNTILTNAHFAFGNEIEIFALRWDSRMIQQFEMAVNFAVTHHFRKGSRGKLWEVYRAFNGYNLNVHEFGKSFGLIEDETDDFDTLQEYKSWLKRWR